MVHLTRDGGIKLELHEVRAVQVYVRDFGDKLETRPCLVEETRSHPRCIYEPFVRDQALLYRIHISIHASEIDDTTVNRGGAEYRTD